MAVPLGYTRYWCSYQRHCGNAGAITQRGSDSAVAAESGSTTQSGSTTRFRRVLPARATNPRTGGRLTPTPAHVPGIFFNTDGIHWLSFPVPYRLLEIVVLRWRRRTGWPRFYSLYGSFVFLSSPLRAPLMCSIGCLPFRFSLSGRKFTS